MKDPMERTWGPTGPMDKEERERFVRLAQEASMDTVLFDVKAEIIKATEKHGPFPTAHHGYAVILEELDEAWHEIKHGTSEQRLRAEMVQVAAMAVRFLMDCK